MVQRSCYSKELPYCIWEFSLYFPLPSALPIKCFALSVMDSSCLYPTLGKLYFYFCFHLCFSAKIALMRKPRTTVRLFSLVPFLQELYLCTALCLMCEEGCFMYFIKFSVCVWRANPGVVTISWLEVKASSPWFLNPLLFSWYLSWQYHCFSYISLHIFPHQHNPKPCYCSPKEDPSV